MIELYFWTTDNGYKARHMMEESGLDYIIKPINLLEKEQFNPEFLKIRLKPSAFRLKTSQYTLNAGVDPSHR